MHYTCLFTRQALHVNEMHLANAFPKGAFVEYSYADGMQHDDCIKSVFTV
jgi:hypothetical protein